MKKAGLGKTLLKKNLKTFLCDSLRIPLKKYTHIYTYTHTYIV